MDKTQLSQAYNILRNQRRAMDMELDKEISDME